MRAKDWPAYVFCAVVAAALPLYALLGHTQWFFNDDWDFLVNRDAGSLHDLLRPHNEHWSTLPILEYRLLWHVVGLRSYVPYQVPVILLHLTIGVLLWLLIRRLQVRPWLATLLASAFVLYGTGRQDIVWGFQSGFDGSLVLGLGHLLLADHDGPLDRRDAAGVACGILGLLCSGVSVTMVFVVGLATLVRRGWRVAALHTVPPAAIYFGWWMSYDRGTLTGPKGSVGEVAHFAVRGISSAFASLGQVAGVGAVIFAMLVAGLVLAWARLPLAVLRRRAAIPIAMLLGAVFFFAVAGYGRVAIFGTAFAERSRYAHIAIAMVLPALAVGADALVRAWRYSAYVIVALVLVGIPGNLLAVRRGNEGVPGEILAVARSPLGRRVPRSDVPYRTVQAPLVTVGWLRDAARAGKLPKQTSFRRDTEASARIRLALSQGFGPEVSGCSRLSKPIERALVKDSIVEWSGGPLIARQHEDGQVAGIATYHPEDGARITVRAPLTVRFQPGLGAPVHLCVRSSRSGHFPPTKHVVRVPDEVGKNLYLVAGELTALRLNIAVDNISSSGARRGNVVAQQPAPGTEVHGGSVVRLTISRGPP